GSLAFVHPDHPIELRDAMIAAQILVAPANEPLSPVHLEAALQQSWRFPEARTAVERCAATVLVTDLMSSSLPYRDRLDMFTRSLLGVLELAPPDAIHWVPTQQIVNPRTYLRAAEDSPSEQFFAGAVNVRFFTVESSSGEVVMDTLGLAAL